MPPKTSRREMTNAEKGAILVLYYLFYTYDTISFIVGRPYMTVKNFICRTSKESLQTTRQGVVDRQNFQSVTDGLFLVY
ncbi:hypothetical protein L211DRAFT_881017 [Terfezia boudieri ATCC MYA-4762]|uniref:Uncharacterized protein n=1 Tax=Terfezia boudieri ATCC MYA-4762 TaxID=1051890 RepID=A0A3N4M165_9PEZI|nr:hypothetical protein L211DRAFT_881017 [Terfezia boudieri ATCC MYA-4762]